MDIDMAILRSLEREKEISFDILVEAIEQALLTAYHKTAGAQTHARVVLDRKNGHVTVLAAETDDVVANATGKLTRKGLDLIVANDVSAPGTGFQHETNAVTIVSAGGLVHNVPLTDKRAIARAVLDAVVARRRTLIDPTEQEHA